MPNHHFISYSRIEAKDFALRLGEDLAKGAPPVRAWLDVQDIPAGVDWDDAIAEAIKACETLIFIMTPDSVRPDSQCKNEWAWALRYKKAVVPLLLNASAEAPFRLFSRQRIDYRILTTEAKVRALLAEFPTGQRPTVLLLDNFEDVVSAETFQIGRRGVGGNLARRARSSVPQRESGYYDARRPGRSGAREACAPTPPRPR